ncbi:MULTISPECIES: hypothetical protein [Paenibacillus]|nr:MULTISPECIES: hypothetical protein [Paenibacillus]
MTKKPLIYLLASAVIVAVAFLLMNRALFTTQGHTVAKNYIR